MAKSRIVKEIEALGNDFDRHWQLIDVLQNVWRWANYCYLSHNDTRLHLSTGGWSEHEAIVAALEKTLFWQAYWQLSRRGGHYEFDISKIRKP
jgi:hypothetical protein